LLTNPAIAGSIRIIAIIKARNMNEKKYLKQLSVLRAVTFLYLQGINAKGIVLKKGIDFFTESVSCSFTISTSL